MFSRPVVTYMMNHRFYVSCHCCVLSHRSSQVREGTAGICSMWPATFSAYHLLASDPSTCCLPGRAVVVGRQSSTVCVLLLRRSAVASCARSSPSLRTGAPQSGCDTHRLGRERTACLGLRNHA